jgi:IS30 family transposase
VGKTFSQLTYDDRVSVSTLLKAGMKISRIAEQLGVHRSTISREISRNGIRIGYLPLFADEKLKDRRKRRIKLCENKALREKVFSKIKLGWSPEQIAGRLKLVYWPDGVHGAQSAPKPAPGLAYRSPHIIILTYLWPWNSFD